MPFLTEARRLAADPHTGPLLRATLDYMLQHSIGRSQATPIDEVVDHLINLGFDIDRQVFQHQVLVPSREGPLYIAAFGNFRGGGIYLIADRADAQPMIDFYRRRMESEQRHVDHLIALRDAEWPPTSAA